jgi:hypothetical protein
LRAVWRKIFRTSLVTAVEEGGQDALLQAIFDFQSQIRSLDAVFDRSVLTALLDQEASLQGFRSYHVHESYNSSVHSKNVVEFSTISDGRSSANDISSTCDTMSLTEILNPFIIASSTHTSPAQSSSSGAGAAYRYKRSKGIASSAFAVDAARTLQSKLAAEALQNSPDEASHVHARVVWLMSSPSPTHAPNVSSHTDKFQQSVATHCTANGMYFLSPALMRDVVRLCTLACDTGTLLLRRNIECNCIIACD